MYCKNCGNEIDDNAYFCIHCGFRVGDELPPVASKEPKYCTHCGRQIDPNAYVCIHCGVVVNKTVAKPKNDQSLLCAVFGFILALFANFVALAVSILGMVISHNNKNAKNFKLNLIAFFFNVAVSVLIILIYAL